MVEWRQKDRLVAEHSKILEHLTATRSQFESVLNDRNLIVRQVRQQHADLTLDFDAAKRERDALQKRITAIMKFDSEIEKRAEAKAKELAEAEQRHRQELRNREVAREKINALLSDMKED